MTSLKTDISEKTLEALRSGEQQAYGEVYTRYAAPIREFITALIRNEEDARELSHDLFLSLWTDRDRIVPEKGIRGFLYTRAKQLAMNYFDRKRVRDKYEAFCLATDAPYEASPDQIVVAKELRILIELTLRGMSEQKQAIYRMRCDEGRSIDEVARELGLSPVTVKNNMTMINKSIREVLVLFMLSFLP